MTNTLALWLGFILLVIFGVDWLFNDLEFTIAFMKRLSQLIKYIAFWR